MNLFVNEALEGNGARTPVHCMTDCTGTTVGVTCSGSDCLGGCKNDACYNDCNTTCYDKSCKSSCYGWFKGY